MYDIFHGGSEGIANISNTVILIMLSSEIAFCCHIRVILHVHDSVSGFYKNHLKNWLLYSHNTSHAIKHLTHLKSSRAQSSSCHRYTCWFLC